MSHATQIRQTALAALAKRSLDISVKGIPPQSGPVALGEVGGRGWNLLRGDLTMPVAVLSRSALEHNSAWMRAFAEKNRLSIAPHGKTTLAPQLFDLQARDGAWAITVSNVQQVALCRAFGFDRILIANQIVGRTEIDYLFGELDRSADLELLCLVDSREGVRRLARGAGGHRSAARLGLLLEIGIGGGRTGARTVEAALAVAREVRDQGLSLRGVEGFEGILKTTRRGRRISRFPGGDRGDLPTREPVFGRRSRGSFRRRQCLFRSRRGSARSKRIWQGSPRGHA